MFNIFIMYCCNLIMFYSFASSVVVICLQSAPDVQYSKKGWLVKQGVTDKASLSIQLSLSVIASVMFNRPKMVGY